MEFLLKNKLALGLIASFVAGAGISYYITRSQVHAKVVTETRVVEKIVEKVVEKKVYVANTKVDKKTVITKNKDGSETTVITDKTVIDEKEKTETDKVVKSEKKETDITTVTNAKDWRLGLQTNYQHDAFEVNAGRRLFWDIWVDVSYDTKAKQPKAGLSLEF